MPKVSNVIDNARKGAFKSTNSMIVSELQRENALEITPQVYTFTDGVIDPELSISGELPDSGTIEINAEGKIQVVTNNDDYCAIKRFDEDTVAVFNVGDRLCNVIVEITLTVDPNGGTYEGIGSNTTYTVPTDGTQEISEPIKYGYIFDEWNLEGEGLFESSTFTAAYGDAILTASWIEWPTLSVNLNGGTTSQSFNSNYEPNSDLSLISPTKDGNLFTGWTVSGTGASINENILTMGAGNTTITATWLAYTSMYTYTGSSTVIDDGDGNWRIKFLTSGTFTPEIDMTIDIFIVGGGGGTYSNDLRLGGGGGGGYTGTWARIALTADTGYNVVVGAGGAIGGSGGASSFNSIYSKNGGSPGGNAVGSAVGGAGGSGGGTGINNWTISDHAGGTNGGSGGGTVGGSGQGSTTREFGEENGTLYAGGGGGGCWDWNGGIGGTGGGGNGATLPSPNSTTATPGGANTGGGGGGRAYKSGSAGGSGIVIIRNTKINEVGDTTKFRFSYAGAYLIVDSETDNWKVKFLTNGTFTPLSNITIDIFVVGGGGGGGWYNNDLHLGGGGGGGYAGTWNNISLTKDTPYTITIGAGGAIGGTGGHLVLIQHIQRMVVHLAEMLLGQLLEEPEDPVEEQELIIGLYQNVQVELTGETVVELQVVLVKEQQHVNSAKKMVHYMPVVEAAAVGIGMVGLVETVEAELEPPFHRLIPQLQLQAKQIQVAAAADELI